MKNLKVLLIPLFSFLPGLLQSATITGVVTDRAGQPVASVNVTTDRNDFKTTTDENGRFVLKTDTVKIDYLTFSHVSYQPVMHKVKSPAADSELKIRLDDAVYPGQKIRVTAMRAQTRFTPVAYSDFTADEIERDYTVADFPILLEMTPNMYAISYTGGMVGASDFKIRGFDYQRIGVYINGIPLNDPEDRFTYFYDLPDFAAEVTDIQVQRGVGNSLYGDATFGGSINIASGGLGEARKISFLSGYGRYLGDGDFSSEMRKQAVEYSSGLIDGRWMFGGRYSKLYSGGYRENSWYDGWAYYFTLSRLDPRLTTTVNMYGGPMKAHLAFDGIDRDTQKSNRRYNPAEYGNEIDDFNQPHYELHNSYQLNDHITLRNTLYYIRGDGYYEQYKDDQDPFVYNITADDLIDPTLDEIDLVRQKWVSKNQYGANPRLDWNHDRGIATFGGSFYYFNSEHWGQVIWAENVGRDLGARHRYYEYFGEKYSASLYALEYYSLSSKFRLMGILQLRYLKYDFDQTPMGALPGHKYDVDWLFLSPRIGLTCLLNDRADIYASFAVASREPSDVTIYDAEDIYATPQLEVLKVEDTPNGQVFHFGDPYARPERLYNLELGANMRGKNYRTGLNLYWMEFRNEIIPEGGLDDAGNQRVGNADRSRHVGIEFEGSLRPLSSLTLSGNASYSHNRIRDYIAYRDTDWDGFVDDTTEYSGNPTAGFPNVLTNFIVDYQKDWLRLTYRLRAVGKQYIENGGNDSLAIDPYTVSSLSASASLKKLVGMGNLILSARIDNLFNRKYEQSGYAYEWSGTWYGEYYVGAERSYFVQLKWEFE
jgi:iron complex outermembrane receptor protein